MWLILFHVLSQLTLTRTRDQYAYQFALPVYVANVPTTANRTTSRNLLPTNLISFHCPFSTNLKMPNIAKPQLPEDVKQPAADIIHLTSFPFSTNPNRAGLPPQAEAAVSLLLTDSG